MAVSIATTTAIEIELLSIIPLEIKLFLIQVINYMITRMNSC